MGDDQKPYPSDVSDDEWSLVAPYLALIDECAPQRRHSLREVFNALRWVVERSFGWLARFKRLSQGFERLPEVLTGLHFLVFAMLMLPKVALLLAAEIGSQHALAKFLLSIGHCPHKFRDVVHL